MTIRRTEASEAGGPETHAGVLLTESVAGVMPPEGMAGAQPTKGTEGVQPTDGVAGGLPSVGATGAQPTDDAEEGLSEGGLTTESCPAAQHAALDPEAGAWGIFCRLGSYLPGAGP